MAQDAPVHPLQHALKDMERAYKNFFAKRAAFPKFKKRGQRDSFRYPDPKQFKLDQPNGRIFLPKLGWMRLRLSRPVPGELRNATVSFKAGKWCVSIQTEREVEQPVPHATSAIGIDVGIARFATMSDGTFVAPLNSFKKHEARLRRCQRAMSRKVKFSNNWKKPRPESSASMRASPMLAATTCTRPRPRSAKPRDGVYRGLAGSEYVQVGGRQHRCAWQERSGQVRSE